MKKGVCFILGIVTGVILTFVISFIIGLLAENNGHLRGVELYDEPWRIVEEHNFQVFQCLTDEYSLAHGCVKTIFGYHTTGIDALIFSGGERPYYDGQIISLREGQAFRQVGIYRYTTNMGTDRTVPIVMAM